MSLSGRYFLVDGDKIIEGPRGLPKAWRNVSGLDKATGADLAAKGWLPEDRVGYEPFDPDSQRRSGAVNAVKPDRVVSTYSVINKTAKEMDDEKEANAGRAADREDLQAAIQAIAQVQAAKKNYIVPADLPAVNTRMVAILKANR